MTNPLSLLAAIAAPEPATAPEPVTDPALFGTALLAAMQTTVQAGSLPQVKLIVLIDAPIPESDDNRTAPEAGPGLTEQAANSQSTDVPSTTPKAEAVTPESLGELLAPAVRVAQRVRDQPVELPRDRRTAQTNESKSPWSLTRDPSHQGLGAAQHATQPPPAVQLPSPKTATTPTSAPADALLARSPSAAQTTLLEEAVGNSAAPIADRPALGRGDQAPVVALPTSQQRTMVSRQAPPVERSVTTDGEAAQPVAEPPLTAPIGLAPGQVGVEKAAPPGVPTSSASAPQRPDPGDAERVRSQTPAESELRPQTVVPTGKPAAAGDAPLSATPRPRRERLSEPLVRSVHGGPEVMLPHDSPLTLPESVSTAEPHAAPRGDESLVQQAAGTETPNPALAAALTSAAMASEGMPHRALAADSAPARNDRRDAPPPRMILEDSALESAEGHLTMRGKADARPGDPKVSAPRGSLASAFAHALADLLSEAEIADVRVVRGRPESASDEREPSAASSGRTAPQPAMADTSAASERSGSTAGNDQAPATESERPQGRSTRGTHQPVADAEGDTAVLTSVATPLPRTPLATVTPSRVAGMPPSMPEAAWELVERRAVPPERMERKLPSDRQELPPDPKTRAHDADSGKREPVARGDMPSDTHTNSSSSLGGQIQRGGESTPRPHEAGSGEARNLPSRDWSREVPAGLADRVTLQLTDADGRPTRIRVAVLGEQVRAVILPPDMESGRQLERRMDDLHAALVRQGFVDPRVSVQQSVGPEAVAGWVPPGRTDVPVPRGAEQPAAEQRQGSGRREQQQHGEQQRHPQGRSRDRDPEPRERESAS